MYKYNLFEDIGHSCPMTFTSLVTLNIVFAHIATIVSS